MIAGLDAIIEILHLALSIVIGALAALFLKRHQKNPGKAAVSLLIAIFFLGAFEGWEAYVEIYGLSSGFAEKVLESGMLAFFAIALLIEMKASAKK